MSKRLEKILTTELVKKELPRYIKLIMNPTVPIRSVEYKMGGRLENMGFFEQPRYGDEDATFPLTERGRKLQEELKKEGY